MKRAILIIGVILMGLTLRAQSVTYSCRYWFDKSDTQMATTEFTGSLWEEELDVGTLTYGLHTLHLQVMDASTDWSAPESFLFLKLDAPSGLECHYWFDQDLEGKQVTAFSSTLLLDVDALDLGMHTLHILLKGTEYTSTESYLFLKVDTPEQIESYTCHYWFDQDFDNLQSVDFGDGNLLLNVADLTDGIHTLHLTLEGTTLTSTESYLFAKIAVEESEEATYRYWFDRDFDNSETFVWNEGVMLLDVSGLDNGLHSLHLMKEGSSNSSAESYLFVKIPVEDPEAGMQYHCWFDQDYNTVQTGSVGNGVFLVNVGALTIGEHNLAIQFDDGNRYSPETYTFFRTPMVTVTINPVDAGTATSSVVDDTICTLVAVPNVGYDFVNFTQNGEVISTNPEYTFTLLEDTAFEANFVLKSYEIAATANPADGGTVGGDGVYYHFSTCTLTATPATGYHFLNWTLNGNVVSESETFSFEVDGPASYVAQFEVNSYEITATANPADMGTVEGYGIYNHFSTCTLTATPATGYHFVNWTLNGQQVSNSATYSFTVEGPGAYVANFEVNSYEITVAAEPVEGGTVNGGGTYEHFSQCTLTATVGAGYSFVCWTKDGEVVANTTTYTFEVTEGGAYVAHFSMNTFAITATVDPANTGTIAGAGTYAEGVTATLVATPNPGFEFVNWTKDGATVSTNASYSFTVTEDAAYVAHFQQGNYVINVLANPSAGGTVAGGSSYAYGATATLTATPNVGYTFINWTYNDEVVSTDAVYSFTVEAGGLYVANFELQSFEITATVNPEEGGTVGGAGSYNLNQACTLTAEANEGYVFMYWSKDGQMVSPNPTYSFTVTEDAAYVANFEVISYYITVTVSPTAGGTVNGGGTYNHGTTATLTATPNTGYQFVNWTQDGEVVSTEAEYSFTVTEDGDFVANFELESYAITAVANPANAGTVAGMDDYDYLSTCTLTATPAEGFDFANWTEDGIVVSLDAAYSFTVTGSRELVANFVQGYHWNVDVHAHPNTMTMVGVIWINGVEQTTTELEIGAFCGEECRGRERLTDAYYQSLNRYFVFLTVYGEGEDETEEINFRLYDRTLNEEIDLTCASILFSTNATYGNPEDPYIFDFGTGSIEQATNFAQGWNWWSTYVEGTDLMDQMKEGLGTHGQQIKSQTKFTQYNAMLNMWIGQLGTIDNELTYMIQTNSACEVVMGGPEAKPADHPITLMPGWNWIGFPSSTGMAVSAAFSGITPVSGDQVKSQNGFATYNSMLNMWIGNLNSILPGMGLQYKSSSTEQVSLVYPGGIRGIELEANVTNEYNHWTNDVHAYPDNMTVTAVVELDDEELVSDNYEIAVFANGECRGSARLMYVAPLNRYMAFLTIAGDETSELYFGLYDTETGMTTFDTDNAMAYTTNAIVGAVDEPYVVSFRGTTGMDEFGTKLNIFPNPVSRGENVTIGLSAVETLRATSVEIINAFGQVVETVYEPSVQTIAAPSVAGVYTLRITVDGEGTYCRKLVVR